MEHDNNCDHCETDIKMINNEEKFDDGKIPTEQLLLSIVRMGSLTSIPKTICTDHQDEDVIFPPTNATYLMERFKEQLKELPNPLRRQFRRRTITAPNNTIRI